MYDIIVVGAGPAGLTAGIYARRSNKNVLILEANTFGGQIVNTLDIENYPGYEHISGFDFANKLYNQTKNLGAEIKFERVIEIKNNDEYKEVVTNKESYKCKAIILATGVEKRTLGLENEKELVGKGVSYCATCDGAFFKNKDVAIIGGENVALEDSIYLSNIVNKVYLIYKKEQFKADSTLVEKVKSINNIEILLNTNIKSINGNNMVEGITIIDKDNNEKDINVSGLFIAIGRIPENENFRKIINMNELGYIIGDEECHTNVEGIFVAGDTRVKKLRQLVTATNDGAIAATEAIKYINKK